jgi:VanZ family protein
MRKQLWLGVIGLVVYCGFIFYLSSIPAGSMLHLPLSDKLKHFFLYLGLGLIFIYFLSNLKSDLTQVVMGFATFFFMAIYGLSDEVHQTFVPGRHFEVLDILVDILGGITGWLLFRSFR